MKSMRLPAVQRRIALAGSELLVNYRTSSLSVTVKQHRRRSLGSRERKPTSLRLVRAGDRAPQATFLDPILGRPGMVFQLFQDGKSHLLLFSGPEGNRAETVLAIALAEQVAAQWSTQITPHVIYAGRHAPAGLDGSESLLLDPDHEVHAAYNVRGPALCLLRPDGYIGFISSPIDENALFEYLQTFFVPDI